MKPDIKNPARPLPKSTGAFAGGAIVICNNLCYDKEQIQAAFPKRGVSVAATKFCVYNIPAVLYGEDSDTEREI